MNEPLSHAEAAKRYLLNEPISKADARFWTAHSNEAGRRYFSLQYAVSRSTMLSEVPRLFIEVVKSGDWKEWVWAGRRQTAASLGEYVTRSPPQGLGATLAMAETWVRPDKDAHARFAREAVGKVGRPPKEIFDNIKNKPPTGTSRAYTVRRLREQHPELYQQVLSGKLSVNQAAVKAGFRKQLTPFDQVKKLLPKLTSEQRQELRQLLDMDSP